MIQSETQLVHAFMDWVEWKANSEPLYSYMHHIVNEGKRSFRTGRSLVRAGMKKGLPDYNLPLRTVRFAGLYIEFKTETGSLSQHQIEWIVKLRAVGHQVVVCRCLPDAQFITEQYIAMAKHYLENNGETTTDSEPIWEFTADAPPSGRVPRRLPVARSNKQSVGRKTSVNKTSGSKITKGIAALK